MYLLLLWVFINAHPYVFDKIPNKTHTIILVGMLDCMVQFSIEMEWYITDVYHVLHDTVRCGLVGAWKILFLETVIKLPWHPMIKHNRSSATEITLLCVCSIDSSDINTSVIMILDILICLEYCINTVLLCLCIVMQWYMHINIYVTAPAKINHVSRNIPSCMSECSIPFL